MQFASIFSCFFSKNKFTFAVLFLVIYGCGEQKTLDMDPIVPNIELAISLDTNKLTINEPIIANLIVRNTSDSTVSLGLNTIIDWELISFASPNSFTLIAPNGENMGIPHLIGENTEEYFLTVPSKSEKSILIPLYKLFDFSESGEYSFALNLSDSQGINYSSNRVEFTVEEETSNLNTNDLLLELNMEQSDYGVGEVLTVSMDFINNSEMNQQILLPQDDSFDGWVNPIYKFVVKDEQGKLIPMPARDGTMGDPNYLAENMRIVNPKQSTTITVQFPYLRKVLTPGKYSLKVVYIVRRQQIGKTGVLLDEMMDWPSAVYIGAIRSNTISFNVF